MKTFYNVISSIICCAKEALASIILDWKKKKKQRLIALFTSNVMYIYLKAWFTRHQICHQDLLVLKVNLSNTKLPAWFLILASLLDRGMQRVNFWLPLRTIFCWIKVYFGAVQLSIVSPTECLERLQINLINTGGVGGRLGLFCLGRICFPGLIYSDRRWLLFLGVHVRLLTWCKTNCLTLGLSNYFSLKSISLSLKSHMICGLQVYCLI